MPGRKVLLDGIDQNFASLESRGIHTVAQLKKHLSAPAKLADVALASGIPEEYLVVLRREIGNLEQKPVPLSSFPGIDPSLVLELCGAGLKTSKDYWEEKHDFSDVLFCLCDLVRINGVGPVAAKMFYEAGYRSVSVVSLVWRPLNSGNWLRLI